MDVALTDTQTEDNFPDESAHWAPIVTNLRISVKGRVIIANTARLVHDENKIQNSTVWISTGTSHFSMAKIKFIINEKKFKEGFLVLFRMNTSF